MTQILASLPLLKGWPDHLLKHLAQASQMISVVANSKILEQGQTNEHLYFLLEGETSVFVDGNLVTKLNQRGDLLGEMSLITRKPVGATILAEGPVQLLKVDSARFLAQEGMDRDFSLSVLYRIYATVLAEKLDITNQKAKRFEDLSIKLNVAQSELAEINQGLEKKVEERTQALEQQYAELQVGTRKLEELINSKKNLFGKLSELSKVQLDRLGRFLDQFRRQHPEEPEVNEARKLLFEVRNLIQPLVDRFSFEEAMNSKRVLYVDSSKKQQIIAKMALGGTGVHLDLASTADEGCALFKEKPYDLVMFESGMVELANRIYELSPETQRVLVTNDNVEAFLPHLKQLKGIPQIVSRNEEDRLFTVKNISTTVSKLLSKDLFGLEKYMGWGVDVRTLEVASSAARAEKIAQMDQYFESLGIRRTIRERVNLVADEMLMNAIYDAPVDEAGKALFNHLDRKETVDLPDGRSARLRFATDGVLVAIAVEDGYGSLPAEVVLRYLERNYEATGTIENEEGKGGAGRGLHQIVEQSDLVIFNIQKGKRTEAIALFNVDPKDKAQVSSSFHLFQG